MFFQNIKSKWIKIASSIIIPIFIFANSTSAYPVLENLSGMKANLRVSAVKHNPYVLESIKGGLGENIMRNDIGVPKEIIKGERRVALTPKEVEILVKEGVVVTIESGAGQASGFSDEDYLNAGAEIASREDVWQKDLIVKVKEPQKEEIEFIRKGQTIFAFLHLAAPVNRNLTETLVRKGAVAIAFETVEKEGEAPILSSMSAIAGPLAAEQGQLYAGREKNKVVILGGGVVGKTAAEKAARLGNEVIIAELNGERRKALREYFKNESLNVTVKESWTDPDKISQSLIKDLREADIIIGAVYVPGSQAPVLIDDKLLSRIGSGKTIVDVAVDQGGNISGSKPTTLDKPTFYDRYGNTRFCVRDIPSLDFRKASINLARNIIPYVQSLATRGLDEAIKDYPELSKGVNIRENQILNGALAQGYNLGVQVMINSKDEFLARAQETARDIARDAANIMAAYKNSDEFKKFTGEVRYDIVTKADREIQRRAVELIRNKFPEHGIVAEEDLEGINLKKDAEYVWVIDPIDGTKAFLEGSTEYGFVVALLHNGSPVMSLLYAPEWKVDEENRGALFEAVEDVEGAFLNGKKITLSDRTDFQNKKVRITREEIVEREERELAGLFREVSQSIKGNSLACELIQITMGKEDLPLVHTRAPAKIWDVISSLYIIEKAGGIVTDFSGNRILPFGKRELAERIPKTPGFIASSKPANKILLSNISGKRVVNQWVKVFPNLDNRLNGDKLNEFKDSNNPRAVVVNYQLLEDNPSVGLAIINANRQLGRDKSLKFVLAYDRPGEEESFYAAINKATAGIVDLEGQFDMVVSVKDSARKVIDKIKSRFDNLEKVELIGPQAWAQIYQHVPGIRDCIVVVCEIGEGNKVNQGDLALWTGLNALVNEGILTDEEKHGLFSLKDSEKDLFKVESKEIETNTGDMIRSYREVVASE